jgi:4-hydroxy-4-methyl-2-oxoglutarate aldolase
VRCSPGDNLAIHLAVEQAPRGSVLVVTADDFVAGYWGEVLTVAAEAAGIVGLVIDGGVRDVAAMTRRRFPVFSRGISVRGTIKASAPSVGQPILMTGVPIAAGDLVVADDDGVVVVPAAIAHEVAKAAAEREANEGDKRRRLAAGELGLDMYKMREGLEKAGLKYID